MLFENLIKAEAMVDYSTLIGRVLKAPYQFSFRGEL